MRPQLSFGWMVLLGFVLVLAWGMWYFHEMQVVPPFTPPKVVLPNPNAYDIYVQATRMVTMPTPPQLSYEHLRLLDNPAATPQQKQDTLALLRNMVQSNAPALQTVRSGFAYDCRVPPVYSFSALFPYLSKFRELARQFSYEGKLAEIEGRYADAVKSYLDCIEFGQDVARGGLLIQKLVSIAIEAIGSKPLGQCTDKLDAKTAAYVARRLEALQKTEVPMAEVFEQERIWVLASLTEVMQKEGSKGLASLASMPEFDKLDSLKNAALRVRFIFTHKRKVLENIDRHYRQLIKNVQLPYPQRHLMPETEPKDRLSATLLPAFGGAGMRQDQTDAKIRLVMVKAALRAYRLRQGRYPQSLNELVPDYLSKVPIDPYSMKPLVYRRTQNGYQLYSIGADIQDDGGRICTRCRAKGCDSAFERCDGDAVGW